MCDRIILPLDGSETANQAIEHAATLAARLQIPIHIVRSVDAAITAMSPLSGTIEAGVDFAAMQALVEREEADARVYVDSQVKALAESGASVTGEVMSGGAAASIVAATPEGDLVVKASHGRSGVKRLLLGSVAEEVMRHASVPVLLVHAAHTEN